MKASKVKLFINGVDSGISPVYSDSLKIVYEREDGEMFRRTKINNTFSFIGVGYDIINTSSIDATFEIRIYDEETNTLLATGTFEKTDCKFNVDNKICEVKVSSVDKYTKILNRMDDEFDLISLAPQRDILTMKKRGILQLYFKGDSKITNVIGGMSYEVAVASGIDYASLDDNALSNTYNFEKIEDIPVSVTISSSPIQSLIGTYRYSNGKFIQEGSNPHIIEETQVIIPHPELLTPYIYNFYHIIDSNGEEVMYQNGRVATNPSSWPNFSALNSWGAFYDTGEWIEIEMSATSVLDALWARILIDYVPQAPTGKVKAITSNDISEKNLNYHYSMKPGSVMAARLSANRIVSSAVQDTPTKWGVNGEGKYFVKPTAASPVNNIIPIGWNRWIPYSYWYQSTPSIADWIEQFSTNWVMRDGIPIWSAISKLLAQIDSTITFGTSEFLYGSIPTSVIPKYVNQLIYITPITNIKKTYYSQAARKGTITLGQILDMLKNTMQLYWFIDAQNTLRIEHITWFKNGGSYSQSTPLIDIATLPAYPNGKTWSFGQNEYEFNTRDLVKRYEFAWNSNCSDIFNGFPIDINNKFAQNGKTSKASVSNFISDIDLIISAPDSLSDDCFALIGTNAQGYCFVPVLDYLSSRTFRLPTFRPQNGYLSFLFLELAYWMHNMSGNNATTTEYQTYNQGNAVVPVIDTMNIKSQNVKFPMPISKIGKEGIIHTGIGFGEWIKEEFTPEDGMVEIELMIDENYVAPIGAYDASFSSSFQIGY